MFRIIIIIQFFRRNYRHTFLNVNAVTSNKKDYFSTLQQSTGRMSFPNFDM